MNVLALVGSILGAVLFAAGGYLLALQRARRAEDEVAADANEDGRAAAEALEARLRELESGRAALEEERDRLVASVSRLEAELEAGKQKSAPTSAKPPSARAHERATARPPPAEPSDLETLRAELAELRAQTAAMRRRAASVPPRAIESTGTVAAAQSLKDSAERLLRTRLEEAVAGRERAESALRDAMGELKALRARFGLMEIAGETNPGLGAPVALGGPSESMAPPKMPDREALLAWLRGLMDAKLAGSFVVLDEGDAVVAGAGADADALARWGRALRSAQPALEAPLPKLGTYVEVAVQGDEKSGSRRAVSWAFPSMGVVACVATNPK